VLIRLLGPVDVIDDDGAVHGSKSAIRRTLLALFAIHAGRVLSADWLLEHVWNGAVPESGYRALRFHVSQLRRELGTLDLVETCPGGYRLRVSPGDVDTGVVESLGRAAREQADDGRAAQLCAQALASWRGEPFIDASPTSDLADEAVHLEELRLSLTELRFRRRFDAGEGAELVAELVQLTGEHPLSEALWQVLMASQYRAGHQADALRSYDAVRSILVETLGVEPSPELQQLHRRVLNQDPMLSAPPARPSPFMLWDVEGATGLLVRQGQSGVAALAGVAELVAVVARQRGGRVSTSQGEGDGALVVFGSVTDAVAAAIEVNERIAEQSWPVGEPVAVRSAVHVGEVTVTADGVFGSAVHRCAGLRASARDGEVLLSDAAVRAVGQDLPDDSSVVDEGSVVLHGLAEPEHVWRLVHPALRPPRGPLLGTVLSPATLPMWRTSFVGRSTEVTSVGARLVGGRLVTLVGPAGVGKTRLAAAVAADASVRACFVDLTHAASPEEVDAVAADALGASPTAAPRAGIETVLLAAPSLVVLDNCEHVVDAAASLVEHLLDRCETSSVLATSRSALRLPDEAVVVVPPLPTTPGGAATQLFIDRAQAARGELTINEDVLAQIGAVTALLDGVPLAIELAAARATTFSVAEILTLLQSDLVGLGDARRRGPDRHRTVRAAIEWSMRVLSGDERRVLCRLAMLPGWFGLSTAIAVTDTGPGDGHALVVVLPTLVEQSLVATDHRNGPTRYRLLEMIRAVGREALTQGERDEVLDRLLVHCLDQVDLIDSPALPEAGLRHDIAGSAALFRCSVEHALANQKIELGLRLVYELFGAWPGATQRATLDRWMSEILAQAEAPSQVRGMVLRRQAIIASEDLGDDERAMRLLDAAEVDASAVCDRQLLGRVRATRAALDLDRGRLDGLETRIRDAITMLEESGDPFVASALLTLAELNLIRGEFDHAADLLSCAAAANPPWSVRAHIELGHAWCDLTAGRVDSAATRAATTLELAERLEDLHLVGHAVGVAGMAALARGESALAGEIFVRMLALVREHELPMVGEALIGLAVVSVLRSDLTVARSCRDEFRRQPQRKRWPAADDIAHARLACAFVDLADGDGEGAAAVASAVLANAELHREPYARLRSLELLAASIAAGDPQRARELLAAAAEQRTAIGATAWPLEPYRHVALLALEGPGGG
jgi:predicted ATPase/DNA-binding SARP family transcriptional activator